MNNFDFNIGNSSIPTITLLASGLSFNQHCIFALGEPAHISIGLDKESKILAIKASTSEDGKSFCRYSFVTNEKKKRYVLVSASKLRAEIIRLIKTTPGRKGIKYIADFDDNKKMLIVKL